MDRMNLSNKPLLRDSDSGTLASSVTSESWLPHKVTRLEVARFYRQYSVQNIRKSLGFATFPQSSQTAYDDSPVGVKPSEGSRLYLEEGGGEPSWNTAGSCGKQGQHTCYWSRRESLPESRKHSPRGHLSNFLDGILTCVTCAPPSADWDGKLLRG